MTLNIKWMALEHDRRQLEHLCTCSTCDKYTVNKKRLDRDLNEAIWGEQWGNLCSAIYGLDLAIISESDSTPNFFPWEIKKTFSYSYL